MQQVVRIALVDCHRFFRRCIASAIANFGDYQIIFEANDCEEMSYEISGKTIPQILLIDNSLTNANGVNGACWLREHHPEIKIILLSNNNSLENILAMLRLGVKGYLLKDAEPEEIAFALKKVSANECFYPDFPYRHVLEHKISTVPITLKSREIEFLKLAATERTYKEIADLMCVSCRTVDGYRDNLFGKLNVKSRVGLVLYSIRHQIIYI